MAVAWSVTEVLHLRSRHLRLDLDARLSDVRIEVALRVYFLVAVGTNGSALFTHGEVLAQAGVLDIAVVLVEPHFEPSSSRTTFRSANVPK
jgi:hypothetical protein